MPSSRHCAPSPRSGRMGAFCPWAVLELMQRWCIPDAVGLELIAFSGKLDASGKRPRVRFTTYQQRITAYLAETDTVRLIGSCLDRYRPLLGAGGDWLFPADGRPPRPRAAKAAE